MQGRPSENKSSAEGHDSSMESPQGPGKQRVLFLVTELLPINQRAQELFDSIPKEQPPWHKVRCKRMEID